MPKPTKGPRLGGSPAHERMMLANLATELFRHSKITTTETKARRLRPFAERLITKAKRGDLHARRQVHSVIRDKGIVHSLFAEIGPGFASRPGGYTRITKLGPRKGDAAPMAVIELVDPLPQAATVTTTDAPASADEKPAEEKAEAETTEAEAAETAEAGEAAEAAEAKDEGKS